MAYTAIDDAGIFFNTKLYTGTGSSNAQTGVGFQPDFTWIKNRDAADFHVLTDAVRGVTNYLVSDDTDAETTNAESLTGFDSDGFTVGTMNEVNTSTEAFVAWNWKANGAGSSNTDGSISSTVSANTTAGFSIVKYTGNFIAATVGHGLGEAPKAIFFKNASSTANWNVYHYNIGAGKRLYLNTTDAEVTASNYMNDTAPTSTVFSLEIASDTNGDGDTQMAYCFAEKQGFSKFGMYTGNGNADGPFVYTGFRPAFLIVKNSTTAVTDWVTYDNKRSGYNGDNRLVYPNLSNAEEAGTALPMDILSNGFKLKTTANLTNSSGDTFIYMAFAHSPFVNSEGVPTNAR